MKSLVLEEKGKLSLRDFPIEREEPMGPRDVRIKLHTVGICGSDVHYYTHGRIGPFVVNEPMILGHEASGTVIEVGSGVTTLKEGDRVCMEPGIPDPNSKATRLGLYNLDPAVRFWATPPVHGCLRASVVHPAAFTFKVPDRLADLDDRPGCLVPQDHRRVDDERPDPAVSVVVDVGAADADGVDGDANVVWGEGGVVVRDGDRAEGKLVDLFEDEGVHGAEPPPRW